MRKKKNTPQVQPESVEQEQTIAFDDIVVDSDIVVQEETPEQEATDTIEDTPQDVATEDAPVEESVPDAIDADDMLDVDLIDVDIEEQQAPAQEEAAVQEDEVLSIPATEDDAQVAIENAQPEAAQEEAATSQEVLQEIALDETTELAAPTNAEEPQQEVLPQPDESLQPDAEEPQQTPEQEEMPAPEEVAEQAPATEEAPVQEAIAEQASEETVAEPSEPTSAQEAATAQAPAESMADRQAAAEAIAPIVAAAAVAQTAADRSQADNQAGDKEEQTEEAMDAQPVAPFPVPKRQPQPRNFTAVNTEKAFCAWSIPTGWLFFFAHIFLLFALVGSYFIGHYFAQVGSVVISPFAAYYVMGLVDILRNGVNVDIILNNFVPLLALLAYVIAILYTFILLIWSLVRVIIVSATRDDSKRRTSYSRLYHGVMRCFAMALPPLFFSLMWGNRLSTIGISVIVVAAVLYAMYTWGFSWFFNADNEANRPDVFAFWSSALSRTFAPIALILAFYAVTSNWLSTLIYSWRSALVFISDGGVATLIAYYLDLLRPLWLFFISFTLLRYVRRFLRRYGGYFMPSDNRKADKVEYREEKNIYKINAGLGRILFYMLIAAAMDGVQGYGLYGFTGTALASFIAFRWITPVAGVIAATILIDSTRKEKVHIKKHKKKKRSRTPKAPKPTPEVKEVPTQEDKAPETSNSAPASQEGQAQTEAQGEQNA